MEVWKDVRGCEGHYKVSDLGNVKNVKTNRILKPYIRNGKYPAVNLSVDAKRRSVNIHTLVAESFLNHTNNRDTVVDHINNIGTDNRLSNLQIISHRENCSKDRKGYTSKYTGVSWNKKNRKWVTMISIDGELKYLGSFDTEKRASITYDFAVMQSDKIKNIML